MTIRTFLALCLVGLLLAGAAQAAPAEAPPGHVTGIGGVFFKAKDPKALVAWYRDVLGMPVQAWGGAALHYDAPGHPSAAAWTVYPAASDHFAPSTGDFMVNYAVDDLDAIIARLHAKNVDVIKRSDDENYGRFAWILDPEGNKIELWEPRHSAQP